MELLKSPLKSALKNAGIWWIVLRLHRASRSFRSVCYSAAVVLKLGFAVQMRLLPPQFLEQPVFVKPSSITRCLLTPGLPAYRPVSQGDWDFRAIPLLPHFWNVIHFRLMYELFAELKPFEETSQYKKMEQEILTIGETIDHSFHSIEEVVQHLEEYERLFTDLKVNGYKSQEELGNPPFLNEMKVCIARDGEPIYLTQGTHRLAMAKMLDLATVSVGVWTVHKLWAQRCFEKYGGGVLEAVNKGLEDINYHPRTTAAASGQIDSPKPELEIAYNPVEPKSRDL